MLSLPPTPRLAFVLFASAYALAACSSAPLLGVRDVDGVSEVKVVTGFRLDVTVEEETLKEKRIRASAETEITTVSRSVYENSAGQCISASRPGDIFSRDRERTAGRMALTGQGAVLDQGGVVGEIEAVPRVYFLSPIENADAASSHQLSDFMATSVEHPALAGAQFTTHRLDIVATPAGGANPLISCVPELGASRRYEGSGERRAFAWHGIDLTGVPEQYLASMLQDTRDVTVSILDANTRVPISGAIINIEGLDQSLITYAQFSERYLAGVSDPFVFELYAEFADSGFFEFTATKEDYRDGDKIRILKDGGSLLSVTASAPGYLPITGQADLGAGQTGLQVILVSEEMAESELVRPSIETN